MENREWRMENGKRDGRRSKTLRRSLSYGVAGEDEGRAGGGRGGEWARGSGFGAVGSNKGEIENGE